MDAESQQNNLENSSFMTSRLSNAKEQDIPSTFLTEVQIVDGEQSDFKFAYKNLFIVSSSFCLLFTAYKSLQNLQSSIHDEAKTGFISLCMVYTFFMLSSLLLPPFMMSKLGYKNSLLISMLGYLAFTVVHYYPKLWLMGIGSALLGTLSAILWASQTSYISTIAIRYGRYTNQDKDQVMSKFLSIFFVFTSVGMIIGNSISSIVLERKSFRNSTEVKCEPYFCPGEPTSKTVTGQAKQETVTTLISIYSALTLLACLIVWFFLTNLKTKYSARDRNANDANSPTTLSIVTSTMRLLKYKEAILLIPASMFNGLSEGFIYGEFTQAYITCAFGIDKVGWVMVCYGISSSLFALLMSQITKSFDAHKLFLLGLLISFAIFIWCLFYDVSNMSQLLIYVTSALLGISNILIVSQLFAVYGVHFQDQKEAGFSLLMAFKCIGYNVAFAYGAVVCVKVKIYVLIGVTAVTIFCFLKLTRIYYVQKDCVDIGQTQNLNQTEEENIF